MNLDLPDLTPPTAAQRAAMGDSADTLRRAASHLASILGGVKTRDWHHVPPSPDSVVHEIRGDLPPWPARLTDSSQLVAEVYAMPSSARWIATMGPDAGDALVALLRDHATEAEEIGANHHAVHLARTILGE